MILLDDSQGSPLKKESERVFLLRLNVVGCRPRIWRRLLVRESMWLSRLHDCIQILFDWYDYQTHAFTLDDLRFGNPSRKDELAVEDDRDVALADLDLANRQRFTYSYHFGEGWDIDIHVEKVKAIEQGRGYPACVEGERAGPPEDCGGLEAYHDMIACLQEPHTDLGREWSEWLGPHYDPERCDLDKLNKALRKLGK